jgi:hypothetical protein
MFRLDQDAGETTAIPREKAPNKYRELFEALMSHINEVGQIPWQRENP